MTANSILSNVKQSSSFRALNVSAPKIIYIAGYGRSGSTILDIILGNHPEISSLGEVAHFCDSLVADISMSCSCSYSLRECNHWLKVIQDLEATSVYTWQQAVAVRQRLEGVRGLIPLLRGSFQAGGKSERLGFQYRQLTRAFFAATQAIKGKSIFVDSSKTAWMTAGRPYALARLCGLDVRVIHLIRDGRAVMWSGMKGSNRKLAKETQELSSLRGYKTAVSWALVNLMTTFTLRHFPSGMVTHVRYEDLVKSPGTVIDRLGSFLDLDFSSIKAQIAQGKPLEIPTHMIGGNRIVQRSTILVRADNEWQNCLPLRNRLFFTAFLSPIARMYDRHDLNS